MPQELLSAFNFLSRYSGLLIMYRKYGQSKNYGFESKSKAAKMKCRKFHFFKKEAKILCIPIYDNNSDIFNKNGGKGGIKLNMK